MKTSSTTIQQRLEQRLARYVAMPTVSSDATACKEAIQTITAELNTLGFKTTVHQSNHPWVMATTRDTKHVRVLLHAHFDVVMANSDEQYSLRTEEDKLYGRGVLDMKFALACYMEALTDLLQQDELSAYDLGVLVTTDEELGGEHGVKEFLDQGWTCDIAIIPDGGRDFKIEKRAKGFHLLYLDSHGTSTHGSRPWEGVNPLPKLLPAVLEIMGHYKNDQPDLPTVSINGIDTPSSFTQVGDLARARIDVRAFEDNELLAVEDHIKDIADKFGLTMTRHLEGSAVHLDESNPLVQTFIQCQSKVLGKPTEFVESLAASDARYFAAHNIPTILEYIHGGGHHSKNEWILRSSLVQFYEVIWVYIQEAALDRAGQPIGRRLFGAPKKVMRNLLNRS
ncbi:MAG TPA: M20/M25/M40 family metallo-hydrolase [Candidatus Saccharimonadales bacterium]|nr:M20/M25/M40 family metallo-hydrolase [Candidatus Saccharimonadales bacterium]